MWFILYLIFLFLGWNPLLCSFQTNYWYFFTIYVLHAFLLGCVGEINSYRESYREINDRFGWLDVPYASLFVWALFGDHFCAIFSLSFNTQLFISCVIIMIDIVLYFAMEGDEKADKSHQNLMKLEENLKNLSTKVDKVDNNLYKTILAHNSLFDKVKNLKFALMALEDSFDLDRGLLDKMIDNIEFNERRYELLMKPLAECPFFQKNTRIFNALRNGEILSVFHLCQCNRSDLFKIKGLGSRSINDIENFMKLHDLCLGFDVFAVVRRHDFISRIIKQP